MSLEENGMRASFRKIGIAAATAVVITGITVALPGAAQAQRHWHGGGGHWHGGHGGHGGWGGFGWGFGSGLALGFGAPYYGG